MPLHKPIVIATAALTLGAIAPSTSRPATAQAIARASAMPMTVTKPARRGPGLGSRQVVIPASSLETPADIGQRAHTLYRILVQPQAPGVAATRPNPAVGPPYPGYLAETPGSLACVYKLVAYTPGCNPDSATRVATGGSKMIALVDAYDLPTAANDLQTFSAQFGLPAANLKVVYAAGTQPTLDQGWALEEALDIEMAHAMAPNATIALVEAASNSWADLGVAIDAAYNLVQQAGGGEVSMSIGGSEFAGEAALESHFAKQGFVVFYAASGDSAGTSYPSTSPNVVAVGGSAISRESLNNQSFGDFLQETTWADAGGGLSSVFPRPAYQSSLAARYYFSGARAVPDVAAVASNNTPVWVYCTSCASPGWTTVAGTSVATPLMAGMANKWGSFRQSSQTELNYLYNSAATTSAFFNVAMGVCGPGSGYFTTGATAVPRSGYDLCTGLGTPRSSKAF